MPHHHGRTGRSAGVKQSGGASPHGQPAHKTSVSSGAAQRQKTKVQATIKANKPSLIESIVSKSPTLQVIKGMGEAFQKSAREHNLARRKKHITKYNTSVPPSQRIDMTDEMITSNEGLNILREKTKYTTASDLGGKGGNDRPVVKKVVGGQTLLAQGPTEAEVSQSDATNAAETKLTKRRVKARGRKMNIYSQSKDKLTLGKKTLLGYA